MMFPGFGDIVTFVPDNLYFDESIYIKYCGTNDNSTDC